MSKKHHYIKFTRSIDVNTGAKKSRITKLEKVSDSPVNSLQFPIRNN